MTAPRMPIWLRELLSEADNATPDFLRIIAVVGVMVFLFLALRNWEKFDPMTFGTGYGAVLLAAAGAVRINEGPRAGAPVAGPTTQINAEKVEVKQ